MRRKAPALRSIGIDRDPRALAGFWCDYAVELVHGCAHEFLAGFGFRGMELVYSDPPYLHATRRSERRYRYEYTDADHAPLLELLTGLRCQVMVAGHATALYDEMFSDWRRIALQVTTRARSAPMWSGSTSRRIGCTGPAMPAATPPTVSASSARPPAGRRATGTCRRGNGCGDLGDSGGRGRVMARINQASLRAQLDDCRTRFDAIKQKGEASADTLALIDTLFLLVDFVVAVLLEKTTPKTSRNSSLPEFTRRRRRRDPHCGQLGIAKPRTEGTAQTLPPRNSGCSCAITSASLDATRRSSTGDAQKCPKSRREEMANTGRSPSPTHRTSMNVSSYRGKTSCALPSAPTLRSPTIGASAKFAWPRSHRRSPDASEPSPLHMPTVESGGGAHCRRSRESPFAGSFRARPVPRSEP